jgi:hypothetical protein
MALLVRLEKWIPDRRFASSGMTGREDARPILHRSTTAFTTLLTGNGLSAAFSVKVRNR